MRGVSDWVQGFAAGIGGVGLFLVAFLDSSFLSLPQINDLLVVWMVTKHPGRMLYYALMATAGSVAGCLVMYELGRKGGDALLRKRFHARHVDRAMSLFGRYGFLAVVVPALLPPPAPFKVFVVLAGVAGMPRATFAMAVLIGRGLRYLGEGLLAVWYGEPAIAYIRDHPLEVSIVTVGALAIGGLGYLWYRRLRRGNATA